MSANPTNCCPRFNPEGWDEQELHFQDKLFVKAKTKSVFHMPVNIGSVFPRTFAELEKADAVDYDDLIVLSYDPSPWTGEHYLGLSGSRKGYKQLNGHRFICTFDGANLFKRQRKQNLWPQARLSENY
jgi:hypothetical protein